jgi:hypothetical protein
MDKVNRLIFCFLSKLGLQTRLLKNSGCGLTIKARFRFRRGGFRKQNILPVLKLTGEIFRLNAAEF